MPLKVAAKVDRADQDYYDEQIKPMIKAANVEYIGEIADKEKSEFLSGAIALLVPIDWPEPFGLVMIEAMACGTPVIAFNRGSVPEVIDDGLTGFIVEDINGAIGAVDRLDHLSREKIRKHFEKHFTARRMAQDYLAVYRSLADSWRRTCAWSPTTRRRCSCQRGHAAARTPCASDCSAVAALAALRYFSPAASPASATTAPSSRPARSRPGQRRPSRLPKRSVM